MRRARAGFAAVLVVAVPGCAGVVSPGGGDAGAAPSSRRGDPPDCGVLAACAGACAKLDSDPLNCGACERTCVIPNAVAACRAGECAVARCQEGFLDADGKLGNGCELMSDCVPGAACRTACDSTGVTACAAGVATCAPPRETCDARDDDCDGRCDQGALPGCRIPVHRAVGAGHFYTTDLAAARSPPFTLEAAAYFHIYAAQQPGTGPAYLCKKPNGNYFLTDSAVCEGLNVPGRLLGAWLPEGRCDAQPLFRLYNDAAGDHFYTTSDAEKVNAINQYGYQFERVAGYVFASP